jgi:protoheme IX farnesyltransferase
MTAMMHLSKIRIGAAITVTAAFGYMMATGSLGLEMVLPLLGTLILATGASALNQYQEYDYDKLMPRTMNRPIPRGDLSPRTVLFFALFTILAGLGILALSPYGEGWPLVLGMLSVVSYNAVYTPLKRKTALAIVPGSIVGALPPAIGYTAGGGDPFAMDILYVGFFLFIWQIPHFWMLLLKYDKEYQSAGFPVLTEKVSKDQLFVMIFIWTLSLVGLGLVMPIFGLGLTLPAFIFNVSISIWMVVKSIGYFKTGVEKVDGKKWFLSLNIYVILLLFAMAMERVYLNF